ncbi:MAG: AraC family transcriptional regulator [Alistipes sp.]|jgi:AraC-like DNA-binding protein|nr:AraC family transcriptional regulator [Alistipes sp.]
MSPAELKKKAARQSIRKPSRKSAGKSTASPAGQPMIVRSGESQITGIRSFTVTRHVLGYVRSGYKMIYTGDLRFQITAGDIFFLSKGTHYIEEVPDGRRSFEQIMFFYTPEQIGRVIASLSIGYNIDTCVHHTCDECMLRDYVVSPGWDSLRHFFSAVGKQLTDGFFNGNPTAEELALTQLVYQIISRPEGCLRTRVLGSSNPEKELIELQLREYVFSDMSLEELAAKTNRSLSSFKKKFREYYNESPHRWVVRQRLMHARLRIISSDRDISVIAAECQLRNQSYFISLFRREFGLTPMQYREKHGTGSARTRNKKEPALQA